MRVGGLFSQGQNDGWFFLFLLPGWIHSYGLSIYHPFLLRKPKKLCFIVEILRRNCCYWPIFFSLFSNNSIVSLAALPINERQCTLFSLLVFDAHWVARENKQTVYNTAAAVYILQQDGRHVRWATGIFLSLIYKTIDDSKWDWRSHICGVYWWHYRLNNGDYVNPLMTCVKTTTECHCEAHSHFSFWGGSESAARRRVCIYSACALLCCACVCLYSIILVYIFIYTVNSFAGLFHHSLLIAPSLFSINVSVNSSIQPVSSLPLYIIQ